MKNIFWDLPGPADFLDVIVENMRQGRNIVLSFPECFSTDIAREIEHKVKTSLDNLNCQHVKIPDPCPAPLEFLYDKFVQENYAIKNKSTRGLSTNESFKSKFLIIDMINPDIMEPWNYFFNEYEATCRNIPIYERTLFIIITRGFIDKLPDENACMALYRWDMATDEYDMSLFVSSLLKDLSSRPILKKLKISHVTELSLWDFDLARELAEQGIETLITPYDFLREYALRKEWDSIRECSDAAHLWANGITFNWQNKFIYHSAYLALKEDRREIEQRVWKSQITVLFPYLESERIRLIEGFRKYLKVPYTAYNGLVINDIYDLELSHLDNILGNAVPHEHVKHIRHLKTLRNQLAHYETTKCPTLKNCSFDGENIFRQ